MTTIIQLLEDHHRYDDAPLLHVVQHADEASAASTGDLTAARFELRRRGWIVRHTVPNAVHVGWTHPDRPGPYTLVGACRVVTGRLSVKMHTNPP